MIEFTATTHPGNRYQHNEDAIGWSEEAGLWFVADGMGGHARGDIASATAKKALLSAAIDPARSLTDLVLLAHEAVLLEGIERDLPNMGSTLVVARVAHDQLSVGWCGDSRAYLWREGQLLRVTRDHSLLEQLLESGVVAPEEAFGHPRRNVLIQALGINDPRPEPGEVTLTLNNDDLLLLCSDGLHDELQDGTIADVVQALSDPKAIVAELERRVLRGDARDNLSIICLRVSGLEPRSVDVLNAAQVRDQLRASQSSLITTRRRVVDTLELPVVPDVVPREVPNVQAPTGRAFEPESTSENSESADNTSNTDLWLALVGVGLLVGLVLLFT